MLELDRSVHDVRDVGLVAGALVQRGALNDTLVVFFTDHGEQFLERRVLDHSWDLFAEETRAVASFWAEGLTPRVVTERTAHPDIAATIYELFRARPEVAIAGRPVGTAAPDRVLWLTNEENGERMAAVVHDDRQLTLNFDGQRWFHDLADDPQQLDNRYDPDNPEVIEMWAHLGALLDALSDAFPGWEEPDRTP